MEDELFSSNQDLEENDETEVKSEEVSTEKEEEVKQDEREPSFNSAESFNDAEIEEPSLQDLFSLDGQPMHYAEVVMENGNWFSRPF